MEPPGWRNAISSISSFLNGLHPAVKGVIAVLASVTAAAFVIARFILPEIRAITTVAPTGSVVRMAAPTAASASASLTSTSQPTSQPTAVPAPTLPAGPAPNPRIFASIPVISLGPISATGGADSAEPCTRSYRFYMVTNRGSNPATIFLATLVVDDATGRLDAVARLDLDAGQRGGAEVFVYHPGAEYIVVALAPRDESAYWSLVRWFQDPARPERYLRGLTADGLVAVVARGSGVIAVCQ